MQLRVDGQTVQEWTVSTTASDYTYLGFAGGEISVHFVNDRYRDGGSCPDSNLEVDYLEVCGTRYETEAVATETSNCCRADRDKLYTNGNFNFGRLSCAEDTSPDDRLGVLPRGHHPRAYPNPASGRLILEGGPDYRIMLYDLSGRPMIRKNHLRGKITLDISHLRPGVYLLNTWDAGDQSHQQRIVVE